MSHSLKINNLGPVKKCSISVDDFTVFTGPQSNGKSTIAKTIFFFRSIKEDILNVMRQGGPNSYTGKKDAKWHKTMQQLMKDKFLQIFGTSWVMPNDMRIEYTYSQNVCITVSIAENRDAPGHNYLNIEFSDKIRDYLNDLDEHIFTNTTKAQMDCEAKKLNALLNDSCETVFIPSGRNMITLLSTQLNYIFTSLDASQLRNIDYITKKYTELILKLKPSFSKGMEGSKAELESAPELQKMLKKENKRAVNLLIDRSNGVLKSKYRYEDGEERLYLDERNYVKINFASSGQQETVWLFNILFYYLIAGKSVFLIVEEPESHLYPDAQRQLAEVLAMFHISCKNQVLVTTHSPYILGTFNYLLQAGQSSAAAQKKIKERIDKRCWLDKEKTNAYFIHDTIAEDALNNEGTLTLIRNELIDGASDDINDLSDFILEQILEEENG